MKILVVCQYFHPEEFKVNELVEGLVKRGNEVTVLTGKPTYPRGPYPKGYKFWGVQKEEYKGAKIIRLPELTRGNGGAIGIAKSLLSFLISSTWYAKHHDMEVDAILCFQLSPVTMANAALIYKKKTNAKFVHWVQDLWPESVTATTPIKGGPIIKMLENFVTKVYDKSDVILVQSRAFRESICAKGNFENKLVFAPNWAEDIFIGADTSIDNKFPLKPAEDEFCVMFAGNIGEAQDFGNIIKAANLTKDSPKIKWIIVGDGRARDNSEKEVKRLGLEDTVNFFGRYPVTAMPKFFAQADAMLVTLTDQFIFSLTIPSKTQAYMASGKPLLTMLNGVGNDIVEDAKCGLTANAGDYNKLAENVKLMYSMSKEELHEMGKNAKAYYDNFFEKEMVIDRINKILISK
jgi:glycosyltransferase involved in cell wall biosynthesis